MEMRIKSINEDNKKFIIWLINEAEKSKKKTLQNIEEHPNQINISACYSITAGEQEQIALFKFGLGEPISEVKKYFEESAKYWEKQGKERGYITALQGVDALCSVIISDNLDLAKRIASMIGYKYDGDATYPETQFTVYSLRDLVLNKDREVLENVRKIEKKDRSVESYYQGQICKAIVQKDLRLLQDNLEKFLKKHDNLVKYGSYREGKDSKIGKISEQGYFSRLAVVSIKLAKQRGLEINVEQIPEKLRKYLPMELVG